MMKACLTTPVMVALLAVSAPVLAQKATYDAKYPARFPEASKYTKIAVLPFRGNDGEVFASALAGTLQSAVFDGANYFEVKTLDGLNYAAPKNNAAVVAAETARAITAGQKLGVQAVLVGEVVGAALTHADYTEERSRCAQPGKKFLSCERSENYTVQCRKTTLNYSVVPRMIAVANSKVVYSETVSVQDYYDQCNGELKSKPEDTASFAEIGCSFAAIFGGCKKSNDPDGARKKVPVSTDEGLLAAVREKVSENIRRSVAPFNFLTEVEFMSKAPDLPKDLQKKFASASEFAKANRLDRACSDWETMGKGLETGSISLLYNLGVCQEVLVPEEPASALAYFVKADQYTTKPDKLINKAMERMKKMIDRQKGIQKALQ